MTTGNQLEGALLAKYVETGDEAVFAELVRCTAGTVLAACRRIIPDRASADDVAQETFLRLAKEASTITGSVLSRQ